MGSGASKASASASASSAKYQQQQGQETKRECPKCTFENDAFVDTCNMCGCALALNQHRHSHRGATSQGKTAAREANALDIPEYLTCPISTCLMKDPVVTSSGATYERVMIERWLKTHDTDPMTGVAIEKNMLSPNFAIKHAIEQFRDTHGAHACKPFEFVDDEKEKEKDGQPNPSYAKRTTPSSLYENAIAIQIFIPPPWGAELGHLSNGNFVIIRFHDICTNSKSGLKTAQELRLPKTYAPGPIAACGLIKPGDQLIAINECSIEHMTMEDKQNVIEEAAKAVPITLEFLSCTASQAAEQSAAATPIAMGRRKVTTLSSSGGNPPRDGAEHQSSMMAMAMAIPCVLCGNYAATGRAKVGQEFLPCCDGCKKPFHESASCQIKGAVQKISGPRDRELNSSSPTSAASSSMREPPAAPLARHAATLPSSSSQNGLRHCRRCNCKQYSESGRKTICKCGHGEMYHRERHEKPISSRAPDENWPQYVVQPSSPRTEARLAAIEQDFQRERNSPDAVWTCHVCKHKNTVRESGNRCFSCNRVRPLDPGRRPHGQPASSLHVHRAPHPQLTESTNATANSENTCRNTNTWACRKCTFVNASHSQRCEACGSPALPKSPPVWKCPSCTFDNPESQIACTMCRTKRNEGSSVVQSPSSASEALRRGLLSIPSTPTLSQVSAINASTPHHSANSVIDDFISGTGSLSPKKYKSMSFD